jgi:N-methylhydantoinase A
MLRLGIDTGGMFTDVVAFDEDSGELWTTKLPSTPADPSVAFMEGVAQVLRLRNRATADVRGIVHGTTVATNSLLAQEGSFPGLGLIVTRGFRAILKIGRQTTGATGGGPGASPVGGYGSRARWERVM